MHTKRTGIVDGKNESSGASQSTTYGKGAADRLIHVNAEYLGKRLILRDSTDRTSCRSFLQEPGCQENKSDCHHQHEHITETDDHIVWQPKRLREVNFRKKTWDAVCWDFRQTRHTPMLARNPGVLKSAPDQGALK